MLLKHTVLQTGTRQGAGGDLSRSAAASADQTSWPALTQTPPLPSEGFPLPRGTETQEEESEPGGPSGRGGPSFAARACVRLGAGAGGECAVGGAGGASALCGQSTSDPAPWGMVDGKH